jgi:ankyrin repeat protein
MIVRLMTAPVLRALTLLVFAAATCSAFGQVQPTADERSRYTGLPAAAAKGDEQLIEELIGRGANPDVRDARGRTPLHIAAFAGHHEAIQVHH